MRVLPEPLPQGPDGLRVVVRDALDHLLRAHPHLRHPVNVLCTAGHCRQLADLAHDATARSPLRGAGGSTGVVVSQPELVPERASTVSTRLKYIVQLEFGASSMTFRSICLLRRTIVAAAEARFSVLACADVQRGAQTNKKIVSKHLVVSEKL